MFPIHDHNPSGRTPYVTYALIAINIAIFLGYFWRPEPQIYAFYDDWALIPARVVAGDDQYSLITCMFLHGDIFHIGGNMLFLYVFGDNLEDYWGPGPFLGFYIASGLGASALQIAADPGSTIPNIGASGAIAGVMGGYLLLFPRAKVDVAVILGVFATIVIMPAYVVLAGWFALQIFGGFATVGESGGGVAYWAHAGGFIAGVALVGIAWLAGRRPLRVDGHPDHPEVAYPPRAKKVEVGSRVPSVRRRSR